MVRSKLKKIILPKIKTHISSPKSFLLMIYADILALWPQLFLIVSKSLDCLKPACHITFTSDSFGVHLFSTQGMVIMYFLDVWAPVDQQGHLNALSYWVSISPDPFNGAAACSHVCFPLSFLKGCTHSLRYAFIIIFMLMTHEQKQTHVVSLRNYVGLRQVQIGWQTPDSYPLAPEGQLHARCSVPLSWK